MTAEQWKTVATFDRRLFEEREKAIEEQILYRNEVITSLLRFLASDEVADDSD